MTSRARSRACSHAPSKFFGLPLRWHAKCRHWKYSPQSPFAFSSSRKKWRQRSASVRRDAVCACVAAFPHYACARVCVGVRGGVGWGKGGNSHSVLPAALRTSVPTRTEPRAIFDPHERQRARPLAASSTRLRGIPAAARRRHCASAPAVRGVCAERGGGGVRGGRGEGGQGTPPSVWQCHSRVAALLQRARREPFRKRNAM